MNNKEILQKAQQFAFAHRPAVGGFPFLADVLMKAGIEKNIWQLPAGESIYIFGKGPAVVQQGAPLIEGTQVVPFFNKEELIGLLRADQAGKTTFPAFLKGAWEAGVVEYHVDFVQRLVVYKGIDGEQYEESYPALDSGWSI